VTISDKTRKLLWGRAANRCAICKNELVINSTKNNDESIIGEECHIISLQSKGPRYNSDFPEKKIDSYNNLILLCRIHHKMIDDQCETYTGEILENFKKNHEKWVSEMLQISDKKPKLSKIKRIRKNVPEYLKRLSTGKEVMNLINNSYAAYLDHDDVETEQEIELLENFLQTVGDFIEFGSDFDPSLQVRISFELNQALKKLEESGFFVFGAREIQLIEDGEHEQSSKFPVAHVRVVRQTNEEIFDMKKLFHEVVKEYKDQTQ